jgi:hypothetical protein
MPAQGQQFEAGLIAVLSGWGALSANGGGPDKLYSVDLEVVSDVQCVQDYNSIGLGGLVKPALEICAGTGGASACYVSHPPI